MSNAELSLTVEAVKPAARKPTQPLKLGNKTRTVDLDHPVGSSPAPSVDVSPAQHKDPVQPAPSAQNVGVTVRKGAPVPTRAGGGGKPKYPWASMEVGDSFFVPNAKISTFYTLTSGARKQYGKNFRAYKVTEEGVDGVGVWLLEEGQE